MAQVNGDSGSQPQRIWQQISVPFLWEDKPGTPKRDWKMPNSLPLVSISSPTRESGGVSGSQQKRAWQQISVPFLWEEKPGTPKRDWEMHNALPLVLIPSPARLVISVPFEWEEKPGKPFPRLPQPSLNQLALCAPPPIAYATNPFLGEDDEEWAPGWDLESYAFDMPHSMPDLAPLLPHPGDAFSEDNSNQHENWYSVSETDSSSSSSSSASQNGDTGGTVVEFIFPLSPNNAGFPDRACGGAETALDAYSDLLSKKKKGRGGRNLLVQRTLTLGELILLSRKLSCRRKLAADIRKPTLSMRLKEFIQKNLRLCSTFGTSGERRNGSIIGS